MSVRCRPTWGLLPNCDIKGLIYNDAQSLNMVTGHIGLKSSSLSSLFSFSFLSPSFFLFFFFFFLFALFFPLSSLWPALGGPKPSCPCGDCQNATTASPPMYPRRNNETAWSWLQISVKNLLFEDRFFVQPIVQLAEKCCVKRLVKCGKRNWYGLVCVSLLSIVSMPKTIPCCMHSASAGPCVHSFKLTCHGMPVYVRVCIAAACHVCTISTVSSHFHQHLTFFT